MLVRMIIHALLLVASTVQLCCAVQTKGCGAFYNAQWNTSASGVIASPDHPELYPRWAKCVWLIQAPYDYNVVITLGQVWGEGADTPPQCADGVEVRAGEETAPLLFYGCRGEAGTVVSPTRWLWVKFFSDDDWRGGSGFQAAWHVRKSSTSNRNSTPPYSLRYIHCENLKTKCPNYECVEHGYWCDGYNDCGCDVDGCDETACDTFPIAINPGQPAIIGIGVGVGVIAFIMLYVGIGGLEIYLKKRADMEVLRLVEEQKKRARAKNNKQVEEMAQLVGMGKQGSEAKL